MKSLIGSILLLLLTVSVLHSETVVRITANRASILDSPSYQGQIIGQASKGETYTLQGSQGEWYKILLPNGRTGWILKVTGEIETGTVQPSRAQKPPASQPVQQGKAVRITANRASILDNPSYQGQVIGQARQGETYTLQGSQGEWYKILLPNGETGWILKVTGEMSGESFVPHRETTPPVSYKTPKYKPPIPREKRAQGPRTSQAPRQQYPVPFGFGFRCGLNFATMSVNPEPEDISLGFRTGLVLGIMGEIGIAYPFYIQAEAIYAQKGAKAYPRESEYQDYYGIEKIDYLEFPVAFKVKFGQRELKPYLFTGPNLGINLSAKEVAYYEGSSDEYDFRDDIKSIDFALDFGGGIGYTFIPNSTFFFDIRYSLGLNNIVKEQYEDKRAKVKLMGLQIFAGIMFGFGL